MFREATSLVAFRNTCGFWVNIPRLCFDSGVKDLPSAVAVFEGECVDFFFFVAAPGFLAAIGFYLGLFVPFVVGFQVVGLMVTNWPCSIPAILVDQVIINACLIKI